MIFFCEPKEYNVPDLQLKDSWIGYSPDCAGCPGSRQEREGNGWVHGEYKYLKAVGIRFGMMFWTQKWWMLAV